MPAPKKRSDTGWGILLCTLTREKLGRSGGNARQAPQRGGRVPSGFWRSKKSIGCARTWNSRPCGRHRHPMDGQEQWPRTQERERESCTILARPTSNFSIVHCGKLWGSWRRYPIGRVLSWSFILGVASWKRYSANALLLHIPAYTCKYLHIRGRKYFPSAYVSAAKARKAPLYC